MNAGDFVYALNPKYKDGTRLRSNPSSEGGNNFNGVWVPNDSTIKILKFAPALADQEASEFVYVQKQDGSEGWIRVRNLSHTARVAGVTKGVLSNEVVTPDPEYVKGIKLYGVGIKEDPVAGKKMGKGIQHLISTQWLSAMSEFIASHFTQLQACTLISQKINTLKAFVEHADLGRKKFLGYDYLYFTNMGNQLV